MGLIFVRMFVEIACVYVIEIFHVCVIILSVCKGLKTVVLFKKNTKLQHMVVER